jgi:protein-S-isoprenylcysteine O-methyltransferase Ste14
MRVTTLLVFGGMLNASGALIRRSCYKLLGPLFTFELSIRKDHKLVTSGPYSIVRHPSYIAATFSGIGMVLSHLGAGTLVGECMTLGNQGWIFGWAWIACVCIGVFGLVSRMKKEDELLRTEFGNEWEEYRKKVPWKFIPGIY